MMKALLEPPRGAASRIGRRYRPWGSIPGRAESFASALDTVGTAEDEDHATVKPSSLSRPKAATIQNRGYLGINVVAEELVHLSHNLGLVCRVCQALSAQL